MTDLCSMAVAQTCPVKGDVEANIAEHLQLIQAAAHEGAQLIVFPELSLIGYELGVAASLAFSEDDGRLSSLAEMATALAMTVIVGAPIRMGAQLHIGAFIIYPNQTKEIYTKHYLGAFSESAACDGIVPPAEATVFQAGDQNPLVTFGKATVGLAICADIGRASHVQHAVDRGVNTFMASMFVIPSEFNGDANKLCGYAKQHGITVALANYGCATGGLASAGGSTFWSETGALLVQLPDGGTGVAVITETLEGWRSKSVMLSDL